MVNCLANCERRKQGKEGKSASTFHSRELSSKEEMKGERTSGSSLESTFRSVRTRVAWLESFFSSTGAESLAVLAERGWAYCWR